MDQTTYYAYIKHAILAAATAGLALSACVAEGPEHVDERVDERVDSEDTLGTVTQALGIEEDCPAGTSYDFVYGSRKLLFCSHKNIFQTNSNVKRAIVVIRGSSWSGSGYDYYYEKTLAEAEAAGLDLDEIDIIAPRLLRNATCQDPNPNDANPGKQCMVTNDQSYGVACNVDADCQPQGYYRWSGNYVGGGMDATQLGVSVYQALDALLFQVAARRPNLEIIVIAGQSQGGQLVSRYALSSALSSTPNIKLRYWEANAGSLPWLDATRPDPIAAAQCNGFNNWIWGLANLYQYHLNRGLTAADLIANALEREIFWTVGEKDTDPSKPEEFCALSQGLHRNARWANYRQKLYNICVAQQRPNCNALRDEQFLEVPGAGHGMIDSWKSAIGHKILFDADTVHPVCSENAVTYEVFDGLGADMVGCAGEVSFANRDSLCAPGYTACSAYQWVTFRAGARPRNNYWTSDSLKYGGSGDASCWVDETSGTACPSQSPMRVCSKDASGTDPLGNTCNWDHCGYDGSTSNEYFGGCVGNNTAGTLCCPVPQ